MGIPAKSFVAGIGGAVALMASSAHAGYAGVHPTTMHVQVSDGFDSGVFLLDGSDLGNGDYQYVRDAGDPFTGGSGTWNMEWDLLASPAFDPDASVQGALVVRNFADVARAFDITVTVPLLGAAGPEQYFGSAALTVENGTLSGDPVWRALIDGATVAELFTNNYVLDGTGGTNDDNGFVMGNHGGAVDSIGVRFTFELSPHTDMTASFGFGILPGPSSLALLGLGALAGGRRRRR
jgi:uncharacterized protein (TIGR03382 family)